MTRTITRRSALGLGLAAAGLFGPLSAVQAQTYPTRPIKLIVPFAAGGPSDISARAIAEALHGLLGQPVIVENRPGAGAVSGAQDLMSAAADGYTIMMASNVITASPWLYKNLRYDPLRDFRSVIGVSKSPCFVLVPPSFEGNTLNDLIQAAKKNPGKLSYGSAGTGTLPQLATEFMKQAAGIDILHVPYKGSGQALPAIVAGEVDVYVDIVFSAQSYVRAGRLKALGVTSLTRHEQFPDVPTLDEQGLKGFEAISWFGIVARPEVPDSVVEILNKAIDKVLQAPDFQERLTKLGGFSIGGAPEVFQKMYTDEYHMWGKVIPAAGITLESR